MTDEEVKCHDMEANTAVGIVDDQVLERSPFNWLVNKRKKKKKRKKGTFPTKRWQVSHCETPSKPYMQRLAKAERIGKKRWRE